MTPADTYKLSWAAVGLACVASVLQSLVPLGVFIGLTALSFSMTGICLVVCYRRMKRVELEARMEAAFGGRDAK